MTSHPHWEAQSRGRPSNVIHASRYCCLNDRRLHSERMGLATRALTFRLSLKKATRLRLTENAPAACHKSFIQSLNYSNTLGFREFPLP